MSYPEQVSRLLAGHIWDNTCGRCWHMFKHRSLMNMVIFSECGMLPAPVQAPTASKTRLLHCCFSQDFTAFHSDQYFSGVNMTIGASFGEAVSPFQR